MMDCHIHYRDIGDYLSRDEKLELYYKRQYLYQEFSDWKESSAPMNITIGLNNVTRRSLSFIHSDRRTRKKRAQIDNTVSWIVFSNGLTLQVETHTFTTSHAMPAAENAAADDTGLSRCDFRDGGQIPEILRRKRPQLSTLIEYCSGMDELKDNLK